MLFIASDRPLQKKIASMIRLPCPCANQHTGERIVHMYTVCVDFKAKNGSDLAFLFLTSSAQNTDFFFHKL